MPTNIYCTYLTIYKGNKLPPFYIGSTSVDKINTGYHGTVSSKKYKDIYKQELITNPQIFKTKILTTKPSDWVHQNLPQNFSTYNRKSKMPK